MFRTLTAGDFDAVVACFNEAFSDYAVRFSMTAPQLHEIKARRAVVFELSVGAFDGDRLVGFTLKLAVRRAHRRRGIGAALLDRAAAEAEGMVRILNVDARDEGIGAFLQASGAEQFIRQREMARPL